MDHLPFDRFSPSVALGPQIPNLPGPNTLPVAMDPYNRANFRMESHSSFNQEPVPKAGHLLSGRRDESPAMSDLDGVPVSACISGDGPLSWLPNEPGDGHQGKNAQSPHRRV